MSVTLRRQLNEDEKAEIIKMHGRRDFATGLPIPDDDQVQFDHIHAYAEGGETDLNNIAPMSAETNRAKGTLALADYRVKRRFGKFFLRGDRLTLAHLLAFLKESGDVESYGQVIDAAESDGWVDLHSASGSNKHRLYTCPATGWKYFYATVPVDLIESDDESDHTCGLQPRYLIPEKVFELYRHFQWHPVLQPSVGRVVGNRLKLFDGQHKIAGLLMGGRREFEVKVYLTCDIHLLNQTNISAHDKFAQTRFYSSIMVMKLGSMFGADFEEYKKDESEGSKSEAGFLKWLAARRGRDQESRPQRAVPVVPLQLSHRARRQQGEQVHLGEQQEHQREATDHRHAQQVHFRLFHVPRAGRGKHGHGGLQTYGRN